MRSHGGVIIERRRRDECGKIQDSSRVLGLHHVQYLGDLYAESEQTLQDSFSAVSKQASKQARSSSPSRRKRKEKRPRYARATEVHLT